MKCYASDYCQKDKSSCSDVCGGYRVLRALYLTDEGDVYPIYLHEMGELEIIQRLVAGILDNKIVVDTNTRINSENDKISIFDLSKKK